MSIRLRWYKIADLKKADFENLKQFICNREYKPSEGAGFNVSTVNAQSVEGIFIERYDIKEKVADPFGKITEFKRVEYLKAPFRLQISNPQLELRDTSPEAFHSLLNILTTGDNSKVSIQEHTVEPLKWHELIAKHLHGSEIVLVVASQIPISNSILGKVCLAGSGQIYSHLTKLVRGRQHKVDKIQVLIRFEELEHKIQLTANGRALISPRNDQLVELVRKALGTERS